MKASISAICLLAVALGSGLGRAVAADLDYDDVPPPDRISSAYEDPRYRDIYGPGPRKEDWYGRGSHGPRHFEQHTHLPGHPVPPGYVYRDERVDRRADRGPGFDRDEEASCLPREEIERRLEDDGWRDFHGAEPMRSAARVKARRPGGDLFELEIDRCSGRVLSADLIERGRAGPYADRRGARGYERPYY
jgi:hypothetical protein